MDLAIALAIVASVAIGSYFGVGIVLRYAQRRLLDLPGERSSHVVPTPRGGGLSFVCAHLAGVAMGAVMGLVSTSTAWAVAGGGMLVAAVGFMDDHGHVPAWHRLTCHFVACGWVTWCLGALPPVDFGFGPIDLGLAGPVLLVLGLVWFLNLFNFMDGIDGIAAVQAITMSLSATLLLWLQPGGFDGALPLILLAVAAGGFLAWNWPPARIFMGDVGSGYLGLTLGALALSTVTSMWLTIWAWLILGGVFVADATVTLVVRIIAKAPFSEAHRSHAYQRLSRHWGSHRSVVVFVTAINTIWLGPLAIAAMIWPQQGFMIALIALAPLIIAAVGIGAGKQGEYAGFRAWN